MLRVEQRQQADVRVVELAGEAGSTEAIELGSTIEALIDERPAKLVFDLSRLSFISSQALGELVNLYHSLALFNTRLAMAGMSPRIRGVLELLRFEQFFELYDEVDEATAAMTGGDT